MQDVYHAKLNAEGRLVIPAALRKRLGFRPGQEMLLQLDRDGLRVYTREAAVRRLQDWVAAHAPPGRSLADELIAERRAEAAKDAGE